MFLLLPFEICRSRNRNQNSKYVIHTFRRQYSLIRVHLSFASSPHKMISPNYLWFCIPVIHKWHRGQMNKRLLSMSANRAIMAFDCLLVNFQVFIYLNISSFYQHSNVTFNMLQIRSIFIIFLFFLLCVTLPLVQIAEPIKNNPKLSVIDLMNKNVFRFQYAVASKKNLYRKCPQNNSIKIADSKSSITIFVNHIRYNNMTIVHSI